MLHNETRPCALRGHRFKTRGSGEVANQFCEVVLRMALGLDDFAALGIDAEDFGAFTEAKLRKGLGEHMVTIQPADGQGGAWDIHSPRVHLDKPKLRVEAPRSSRPARKGKGKGKGKGRGSAAAEELGVQQDLEGMPKPTPPPMFLEFAIEFPIVGEWPAKVYKGLAGCQGKVVDVTAYKIERVEELLSGWVEEDGHNMLRPPGDQSSFGATPKQIAEQVVLAHKPDETLRETYDRLVEDGAIGRTG